MKSKTEIVKRIFCILNLVLPISERAKKLCLNISLVFLFFISTQIFQAQILFNNRAVINLNNGTATNPIYLTLNNPPSTPITMGGSSALTGVMMEGEYNILKYNLGTATTAITVPYLSYNSESFPLTLTPTTAGTGAGSIQFSSTKAATRATGWDNATYQPSDVTNMTGPSLADNSAYTIDRFWIIDAINYTTKPAVTLDFTYINAEGAANGGNLLTLSNIYAQRFDNSASQTWNGFSPAGTNTTGGTTGTVTGVTVAPADFFRSWTLNDASNPLPVELLSFTNICSNNVMFLKWSTATETNSSYYTLEKSSDGINFSFLAKIPAAQNSIVTKNYSYTDNSYEGGIIYYKLFEVDLNGTVNLNKIIAVNCSSNQNENVTAFSSGENVNVSVYSLSNQPVSVNGYDVSGRLVYNSTLTALQGTNEYKLNPMLATGIYLFEIKTTSNSYLKKMPIEK